MKRTFEVSPWHVKTTKWAPEDKLLQESMTALANENLGMRGFFEEGYSDTTLQGVYLGGVWFPDKTRVGWWKNGYPKYFGKMINAVNFMKLTIEVNGEQVDFAKQTPTDFNLDLDMRRGTLTRTVTATVGGAPVTLKFERFVSAVQKELVGQRLTVQSPAEIDLAISAQIDADVYNQDANYDEQFWQVLDRKASGKGALLVSQTKANDFGTPQFTVAMQTSVKTDLPHVGDAVEAKQVANHFAGHVAAGQSVTLEKRTIVTTSRDYADQAELVAAAQDLVSQVDQVSYDDLLAAHVSQWAQRWAKSDVVIEGDDEAQQGIRFNLFQLFSTYYGNDSRLNISPKGFTGEKYGGATYWDTEAYCLPVYLGVADPQVAKNLLYYRYHQLPGAYVNAKEQGLKGALFPMVTFNGIECHNEWEITFEELHRNGDIAYAIYNYTRYTGDTSYVLHEGAKVLVETARFWADRVHYSQRKNKYLLHGVTGPNEYDNNVNNDWYTNLLCQWSLQYTLEILDQVDEDVLKDLAVTEDERRLFRRSPTTCTCQRTPTRGSSRKTTPSWTRIWCRLPKSLATSCHSTNTGLGIRSCAHLTLSKGTSSRGSGTLSTTSRRNKSGKTSTFTSSSRCTNRACRRRFTRSWPPTWATRIRPLSSTNARHGWTWITITTTPTTVYTSPR